MTRDSILPELLRWARVRSGLDPIYLEDRFPQLAAWESGEKQPTLKQLEAFAKATQMFTLAHELAHIWIGQSALSDAGVSALPVRKTERWCNQVAAEFLAPIKVFKEELDRRAELRAELDRLARRFKVSTLVILRRMHDAGTLDEDSYWRPTNRNFNG